MTDATTTTDLPPEPPPLRFAREVRTAALTPDATAYLIRLDNVGEETVKRCSVRADLPDAETVLRIEAYGNNRDIGSTDLPPGASCWLQLCVVSRLHGVTVQAMGQNVSAPPGVVTLRAGDKAFVTARVKITPGTEPVVTWVDGAVGK